ncbi:MAG: hypothetical protein AB7S65_11070 [Sulfuricurvum sp.]
MKSFFFGFSLWKNLFIDLKPFFPNEKALFIRTWFGKDVLQKAFSAGLTADDKIYIWGRKSYDSIEKYAYEHSIPLYRVEDGFIRSVGLGSDLTQPYSLVVDSRGIYFDPTQESDLEHLLQHHQFNIEELERAAAVRSIIVEKKFSKYNVYPSIDFQFPSDRLIVLVPGQVNDDASLHYGAPEMDNLTLLKAVRMNRPDAYIVYKPHPDVLAGNRIGTLSDEDALSYCDRIITEASIDSVLQHVDEVHTMTSLVGFEAIMRGIKVVTYGIPFYAGWGLSIDQKQCLRRTRMLSMNELVCAVYLLYPRYIHPLTKRACTVEDVLVYLESERLDYERSNRIKIRNWIMRKGQIIFRRFKGK